LEQIAPESRNLPPERCALCYCFIDLDQPRHLGIASIGAIHQTCRRGSKVALARELVSPLVLAPRTIRSIRRAPQSLHRACRAHVRKCSLQASAPPKFAPNAEGRSSRGDKWLSRTQAKQERLS